MAVFAHFSLVLWGEIFTNLLITMAVPENLVPEVQRNLTSDPHTVMEAPFVSSKSSVAHLSSKQLP